MRELSKANSKALCSETLIERILSMQIAPGELLDEMALSQEFGISRTPLREIIQRLCGEGYLKSQENRGTTVAPMDMATLRHFFQAAPMIYASIARLAAENAQPGHIAGLKIIQQDYRSAIAKGTTGEIAMHNHRFHEKIGEMAASPYLMPSLKRLLIDHTRIAQVFYKNSGQEDQTKIETAASQHDQMIEAFENNYPSTAVELTLRHWELSRNQVEQFVSPQPLDFDLNLDQPHMSMENSRAV